jgi:hypothetical protein
MNQMRALFGRTWHCRAAKDARLRRALAEILGDRNNAVGDILCEPLVEMSERLRSLSSD